MADEKLKLEDLLSDISHNNEKDRIDYEKSDSKKLYDRYRDLVGR